MKCYVPWCDKDGKKYIVNNKPLWCCEKHAIEGNFATVNRIYDNQKQCPVCGAELNIWIDEADIYHTKF